jgi:transposase
MDHFAGLDVSVKETSVCIVDDTGKIVREVKVASEPEALLQVLGNPIYRFKRIGLEAGPLSQWLFSALAEAGLPVICVETRHMRAVLQAQINKTDRNDARGMAQMMRAGLFRPVHVKTLRSQKLRMLLLTHRKVRRVLREQFSILHRRLLAIVRDDEVCRRLMTVPGVGPVVALTYRATVDVPARFGVWGSFVPPLARQFLFSFSAGIFAGIVPLFHIGGSRCVTSAASARRGRR